LHPAASSWESPRSGRCPWSSQAGSGAELRQLAQAFGLGLVRWRSSSWRRAFVEPKAPPRAAIAWSPAAGRARPALAGPSQSAARAGSGIGLAEIAQQGWQDEAPGFAQNGVNSKTRFFRPQAGLPAQGSHLERSRLRPLCRAEGPRTAGCTQKAIRFTLWA